MPAKILNGKIIAEKIEQHIAREIQRHLTEGHRAPGLAVILVGTDPASEIYVRNKVLTSKKVGILSKTISLQSSTTQEALLSLIKELNQDQSIDGILVQLPLPSHIDKQTIVEYIRPDKDVDGFHPYNLGRLAQKHPFLRPCTPAGIMKLLEATGINLKGLRATIVGVSNIVGCPMLLELLMAGCTITACHRYTRDLKNAVLEAELLIAAAGHPGLIKGEWIKSGAIVVDVGMNRLDNGHLVGDVEFEKAAQAASWITPVPGGVGPMTVASLLKNTLYAYEQLLLPRTQMGIE